MRTLGQLHLEDLEPHRFEDLVRQLLYDFREWRSLEATGRSGGDGGFDARGREIVPPDLLESATQPGEEPDDEGEGDGEAGADDRLWMIQCKREKAIGPAKARKHVAELAPACTPTPPYGLVFVAACDLSRATRDAILEDARALGFMEVHVWAKGEIEDQLYQPKNDHLLFAYTGFSLQIRRRSVRTDVRARLAAKRKLLRTLKDAHVVLVLEASDQRFPHPDGPEGGHWSRRRHWNAFYFGRCGWDGLRLIHRRCWAICDPETGEWDVAEDTDSGRPGAHDDPWIERQDQFNHDAGLSAFWIKQEYKRAMYVEEWVLPYQNVIDVDAKIDIFFDGPTVHVDDFHPDHGPFLPDLRRRIEPGDPYCGWAAILPDPKLRRKFFLDSYPEPERLPVPPDFS